VIHRKDVLRHYALYPLDFAMISLTVIRFILKKLVHVSR
jgi:hypothetical protein